ncbi:MAG TPA: DNA-binding domain-containing protein [Pirellulales bacterium]|nr:DNA-binding domain-containing protein [Pirellulales bacterium]
MQAVIMHPDGVDAGLASEEARRHLDVAPQDVEQVVSRSIAQTSVERLAIYANAYYARLLECLGEEFPVLKQTLGEETFDAFSFDYLQHYPSQSYTLGKLGENFARYLNETRPAADDTQSHELENRESLPADWPDFLIELATIEWTFSQVFDGPGIEGQTLLSSEQLQSIDAEEWPSARLEVVPCLKLLDLRFPVNAYYTAIRRGESPVLPSPAPTWLAVTRRDFVVRRHELTERQFVLLSALAVGETIGAAIERAAGTPGGSLDEFALELGDWFRDWSANDFFQRVVTRAAD